jgi:hypothetical protein
MTAVLLAAADRDKTFQLIDTIAQTIRPSANLFARILNAAFCHRDCFPEVTRYCVSDFNDGPVRCVEFFSPTPMNPAPAPHMKMALQEDCGFERSAVEKWFACEGYAVADAGKSTLTFSTLGCTITFDFLPFVNSLQSVTMAWH